MAIGGLAVPATALAGAPTATTGTASSVTATTATLNGTVLPNKELTTVRFEFGKTAAYGSQTPSGTANGAATKSWEADLTGLSASTTYHFRIVASNASGTSIGADAQFTTPAAGAAAVGIAARPAIVTFGRQLTISGQVAGRPDERVELEQQPFPFTDPFRNLAQGRTDAAANYSFPAIAPTLNTKYHVVARSPQTTSADITVLVRTRVGLRLSDRTPARGARVRFRGSVFPAHDGATVKIQRRTRTGWRTLRTPVLQSATPIDGAPRSRYRVGIRVRRSGAFRAVMPVHSDHARGKSPRRRAFVH